MSTLENGPDLTNILVGARLRAARRDKGVSQEDLGRGCGITQQQVQKYEKGINRLSVAMMIQASTVLGIKPESLLPDQANEATSAATELSPMMNAKLLRAFELCPALLSLAELSRTGLYSTAQWVSKALDADRTRGDHPAVPSEH